MEKEREREALAILALGSLVKIKTLGIQTSIKLHLCYFSPRPSSLFYIHFSLLLLLFIAVGLD